MKRPADRSARAGDIPDRAGGAAGAVAATAGTPRGTPAWHGVRALIVRDLTRRSCFRLSLLLDLTFGLVNLVVFLFISRVLSPDPDLAPTLRYFDFVAAGITFMLVLQAATTQLTTRIGREQRTGTLEMLAAQPVPAWSLALGLAGYPLLFALLRVAVYLAALVLLLGLDVTDTDWIGVVAVLLASGVAVTGLGIALMAFTVVTGHGEAAARLLVVALAFFSGTYFPVTTLPPVLRWVGDVLPTRIALDGLRAALAGGGWLPDATVLAAVALVGLPVSVRLFDRALASASRRGVLTRG